MSTRLDRRIASLEGQRDAHRANALELAGRCKFLLQLIDDGYTLRPAERKEIEKSIARVRPSKPRRARNPRRDGK